MVVKQLLPMLVMGCFSLANAQPVYKNLAMEGGGIRGIAYIGALEVLDSAGILQKIERVGGSSAGAIQACLLAVGYTPAEIKAQLQETSFKKFNDGSFLAVPGAVRLSKHMGWYKGDAFTEWMEGLIAAKTGNAHITFAELYERRHQLGGKVLYVTGTDLTWQMLRVFSHESYPNMRIADAIKISSSIPFYFRPVWLDENGGVHKKMDSTIKASMVVDGGLLSNFPLTLFDSTKFMMPNGAAGYMRNPETIGLQLEEPYLVNDSVGGKVQPLPINNNADYMKAIYKLLVDKQARDEERTVLISNLDLSPRIRKLKPAIIEQLLASGREGARKFLQRNQAAVLQ